MTNAGMHNHRGILLIDDNRTIDNDFRKILGAGQARAAGLDEVDATLFGDTSARERADRFEIDSAYRGQQGLEMVRQAARAERPYAVAFVDIRMPPVWTDPIHVQQVISGYDNRIHLTLVRGRGT